MKRIHDTRMAARSELYIAGYMSAFATLGRPELWARGRDRRAICRRVVGADETWEIVTYPEPAVCRPDEIAMLTARDGAAMSAGKLIQPVVEVDDGSWLD